MYHGEDTGHLILFVNHQIILINFKQTKSRKISFFIENQLLELSIKKENERYSYEVVPQILTNQIEEEKIFSKHFWIPLILLIIVLNLLFIFLL